MQTHCHTFTSRLRSAYKRVPRLTGWALITLVLMAIVTAIAPHQFPVSVYKLSLVSLAGVVGYWLDRALFPYLRPDVCLQFNAVDPDPDDGTQGCVLEGQPDDTLLRLMGVAMLRRAIIVAAAMVAIGLGA